MKGWLIIFFTHHSLKLSARLFPWQRFCVRQQNDVLELDPELLQQDGHALRLLLHVLDVVHQTEDPQLAFGELWPHLEDERQEKGQAAVVVQPVDVDGLTLDRSLPSELSHPLDQGRVVDDGSIRAVQHFGLFRVEEFSEDFRRFQLLVDGQSRFGNAAVDRDGRTVTGIRSLWSEVISIKNYFFNT